MHPLTRSVSTVRVLALKILPYKKKKNECSVLQCTVRARAALSGYLFVSFAYKFKNYRGPVCRKSTRSLRKISDTVVLVILATTTSTCNY